MVGSISSPLRRGWALAAALSLVAGAARGAPDEAPSAEALFREGRKAADRGDWAGACGYFAESQRLEPAPGTALNLAICHERLGHLSTAWAFAHEAAARIDRSDARAAMAAEAEARLDRRVARLRIDLGAKATGAARVLRDGTPLAGPSLGLPLPVDPGDHTVEVEAPGRLRASYHVSLREGQTIAMVVERGPEAPSAGAQASTTPAAGDRSEGRSVERSSASVLPWVAFGVGAAGLVTSAVTGLMVIARKHTVDHECQGASPRVCTPAGIDAASQGKTLSTVSTAAFAVGVVGVGAGVGLVLWGGPKASTSVSVAPAPGGAAAAVGGSFASF